jgi:hypothetical protein
VAVVSAPADAAFDHARASAVLPTLATFLGIDHGN